MNVCDLVQKKRTEILAIAAHHGASNVRVFGSVAQETSAENNLDFLVELEPNRSLLDRIGLMQDLEDLLGRKVHVVTERGLKEPFRDCILQAAMPV